MWETYSLEELVPKQHILFEPSIGLIQYKFEFIPRVGERCHHQSASSEIWYAGSILLPFHIRGKLLAEDVRAPATFVFRGLRPTDIIVDPFCG